MYGLAAVEARASPPPLDSLRLRCQVAEFRRTGERLRHCKATGGYTGSRAASPPKYCGGTGSRLFVPLQSLQPLWMLLENVRDLSLI